jgi:hypothetical protein
MGGALARVGERKVRTGFWWGNSRERDHFEDLCVDGRVILKQIFKKSVGIVDWIHLVLDWDRWRTL